jgi:hypothetical protein
VSERYSNIIAIISYPQRRRPCRRAGEGPPSHQRRFITHEGRKFRPSPHLGIAKTEEGVMR